MVFYARRLSVERNSYSDVAGSVAGWLGGWLAVTLRYCIKTAKPIVKLFRPSESPIILVYVENRTKIANFHTPRVFNAPADGVPLGILYRGRMMGLSDGR